MSLRPNRWMGSVLSILAGFFLLSPLSSLAYTGNDFLNQLRAKFKTTSNIYLEARSVSFSESNNSRTNSGGTSSITLAYEYPRMFLQKIVGDSGRRQYVIVKDRSMLLSYPHLDFRRRYDLKKGQLRSVLVKHIPLAGALVGLSRGKVSGDSISTQVKNGKVKVTITNHRQRLPFTLIHGWFIRDNLIPKRFVLRGKKNFKLKVLEYVEEERFPKWVEKAFDTFNPKWMKESHV